MKCRWCDKYFKDDKYHACDYVEHRDELYCPHGVGHGEHVHGCDGCCSTKEWKEAWERYRKKR